MGREANLAAAQRAHMMARVEEAMGPCRPFGQVEECPKCGLPREHMLYQWCIGDTSLTESDCALRVMGNHMHVGCPRCKYGWLERPKDYVAEAGILVDPTGDDRATAG